MKKDKLKDYRCIPFWSWNDELNEAELKRQISWMKKNGAGGFFMHARGGLKTEYLGQKWMDCVKTCAEKAENEDMNAWAYDENGWPSGFAGGKSLENHDFHDRILSYKKGAFDKNAFVSYLLSGDKLVRVCEDGEGEFLNLYDSEAVSTADVLNPEAVDFFIKETHEKYRSLYGKEFGTKIAGFFTDEPQYQRWGTAYTHVINKYFESKYGEDILDELGLLFVEKEGYRAFRYKYWKGMQELLTENFSKRIYDWCDNNGVKLTGHYIEETSMGYQIMCCAGVMPNYEYEHIPGIDWLGRGASNMLSPKQVGSVSSQLGKKHVLSEMFACCGWDVTPAELKAIAEFQYVGGVNLMCQHLLPYAEHGQRKRDYPAHYSAANPWTDVGFERFNDYFTKLGFLLANSEEIVDVALFHPIRSCYFDFKRFDKGFGVEKYDKFLRETVDMLMKRNIPFHFIDESILSRHGSVQKDKLTVGNKQYKYILFPKMSTMDETTETILKQYAENGGKILFLDKKPEYLEGEPHDYSFLRSNVRFATIAAQQPFTVADDNSPVYVTLRKNKKGYFIYAVNTSSEASAEQTFTLSRYSTFEEYDIESGESKVVSTTVKFLPNQSKILYFSNKVPDWAPKRNYVDLGNGYEVVSFGENYLTVDKACVSFDGKNYAQPKDCMNIADDLLEARHEGAVWLKYLFEVKSVVKGMRAYIENMNNVSVTLNGEKLNKDGSSLFLDKQIKGYALENVKEGVNELVVKIKYHQNENVFYALYGEGVTESLKNCLVYDTDIENIYIGGDFGVYEKHGFTVGKTENVLIGNEFVIDKKRIKVNDFVSDGFAFFAGTVRVKKIINFDTENIVLHLGGRYQAVKLFVNGKFVKTLLWEDRADITGFAKIGENVIELEITKSCRNLLGPHHYAEEEPLGVGPQTFELRGEWKKGENNKEYRPTYSFVKW